MSDELNVLETQNQLQHPYSENISGNIVCESNDADCIHRLVAAFSDCD